MLHGLVRGAIFTVAHGIVRKDEKTRQLHECREPDRRSGVVAEYEEGCSERPQLRQRQSVHDRRHGVLANAEMQVFAGTIVSLEIARTFEFQGRLVGWSQIG